MNLLIFVATHIVKIRRKIKKGKNRDLIFIVAFITISKWCDYI